MYVKSKIFKRYVGFRAFSIFPVKHCSLPRSSGFFAETNNWNNYINEEINFQRTCENTKDEDVNQWQWLSVFSFFFFYRITFYENALEFNSKLHFFNYFIRLYCLIFYRLLYVFYSKRPDIFSEIRDVLIYSDSFPDSGLNDHISFICIIFL